MDLKKYLQNKKISQLVFADNLKVTQSFISHICNGSRRPSPEIAKKIETATNGQVTVLELLYPDEAA